MALATTDDVAAVLRRTLTAAEIAAATVMLDIASAEVEEWTGYRFAQGTYTVGRRVRNGRVKLPAKVASVNEVRLVDQCDGTVTTVTDHVARGSSIYNLPIGFVEVDFAVIEPIPAVVTGVVAGMVATLLGQPTAGLQQEMIGPYQAMYGKNSGRVYLSASDKQALAKYRRQPPAIEQI